MKKPCSIAIIMALAILLSSCSHSPLSSISKPKVERISDSGDFNDMCGIAPYRQIQTTQVYSPPQGGVLRIDKRIKIVGNIGGRYSVGDSQWRLAGAAMTNSTPQHMISYPTDHRVVAHDPEIIKAIDNIRSLDDVIWK